MSRIDTLIDQVTNLPPAPIILTQLLELLDTPNSDTDKVIQLISCDTALTAQVMRLSNSAFLGAAHAVDSLDEAILRLGFNEVYQMVVALVGGRALQRAQRGYGINAGELWRHSIVTAFCARNMARSQGTNENVTFTAAILHDVGKIVLAQLLESRYTALISEIQQRQQSLLEAETHLLGADHAEVGGRLLERWRFPAHLVGAVTYHHNPSGAGANDRLAASVYLANMISHFMGYGYGLQPFALRGRADALAILGMDAQDLPSHMIGAFENLEAVERLLAIKP